MVDTHKALLREIRGLSTTGKATDSSIQVCQELTLLREISERPSNSREEQMNETLKRDDYVVLFEVPFHNDDCLTGRSSNVLSLPSLQAKAEAETIQGYWQRN